MVKREKFLEDAKADPARFYRTPTDVLRDRRLSGSDRRDILAAWSRALRQSGDGNAELAESVERALAELNERSGSGSDN